MPLESQQRVIAIHPASIVGDANQLAAAAFDFDLDTHGACVQSILQQLLHNRSRTVDHFARGDLIRDLVRKNADAAHKRSG